MLPYRMAQARRALIRRALAATAAASTPTTPPAVRDWEARPKPRIALPIGHRRFAYLATPEAAASMRRWHAARDRNGE